MKKGNKKIWTMIGSLALAALTAASFAGCGGSTGGSIGGGSSSSKAVNPVAEDSKPLAVGGLHEFSVRDGGRIFTSNKTSDYAIVVGSNDPYSFALKAAMFMQTHIFKATGAGLEIYNESNVEYTAASKYIFVNAHETFASASLTMPGKDLGRTGYYIKSKGDSVFLETQDDWGLQYAALSFLHQVIGYEMYADDCVVYKKTGATLPDMEITEKPDIELHFPSDHMESDTIYGMGFLSDSNVLMSVDGLMFHNSLNYAPKATFNNPADSANYHPYWYTTTGGEELCYTAHGDPDEFEALVTQVATKMKSVCDANPTKSTIAITIMDHYDTMCTCDACKEIVSEYGMYSAAVVKFCNQVNRKIRQMFTDDGNPDRLLDIAFFAYYYTETAPVKKNALGNWEPIDETVKCDDNVAVWYAPINAYYNESFYHEKNSGTKETIEKWGACASKMFLWLYNTNYSAYMYPHNSYEALAENYRLAKNNNVIYLWTEGQNGQKASTHFTRLKEYINSRTMIDANTNVKELTDDFFAQYFREAAEPMRKYYNELRVQLRIIEENDSKIDGGIYNSGITAGKHWPLSLLRTWLGYIDEAYAKIEKYKTTDEALYNALCKHIKLESMFPRYALLDNHSKMFDQETLREMRVSFRDDCDELRVGYIREGSPLSNVFEGWGI